jgi:hypothetical protein
MMREKEIGEKEIWRERDLERKRFGEKKKGKIKDPEASAPMSLRYREGRMFIALFEWID